MTTIKNAAQLLVIAASTALVLQALRLRRASAALAVGTKVAASASSPPPAPSGAVSVLVAGDSTAIGVGADRFEHTLAGCLGQDLPGSAVLLRARSGAVMTDVLDQIAAVSQPLGAVVVCAGGNDILRGHGLRRITMDAQALASALGRLSGAKVWMGVFRAGRCRRPGRGTDSRGRALRRERA